MFSQKLKNLQIFDFFQKSHMLSTLKLTCHGILYYLWSADLSKSFIFYMSFHSRTLTIHKTTGEGRDPSFIPLCYFHLFTNIWTFICNFECEMTITLFLIAPLVFTRLLLDENCHLIGLLFG